MLVDGNAAVVTLVSEVRRCVELPADAMANPFWQCTHEVFRKGTASLDVHHAAAMSLTVGSVAVGSSALSRCHPLL